MGKNNFQIVSTGVFDRRGADKVSAHTFYGVMAIVLVWGLGLTAYFAHYAIQIAFIPSWTSLIVLGLVIPIAGIFVAIKSKNPLLSFVGYNMIVIPFGFLLGPVVNQYSPDVVRNAFGMTAAISLSMGMLGTIYPKFFSKIGGFLFMTLIGLLIVRILQLFIPGLDLTIIDYVAAGLFSLYIGYDMYRANNMPKTLNNAVSVCVDLYLDIINLFLNILRIMGKGKK